MSEQNFYNQAVSSSQGNEPAIAPPASVPPVQEQVQKQEFVTPQQLAEQLEAFERKVQSQTDKAVSTVNKKVAEAQEKANNAIEMLKGSGLQLSPEQEASIRRNAIDKAYLEAPQSVQDPTPKGQEQSPQEPQDNVATFVNGEIHRIVTQAGVQLTPEEMQPYATLPPYEFIKKAEEIVAQKRQTQATSAIPTLAVGGQPTNSEDAVRKAYEAERAQYHQGTHPTIKRGDMDGFFQMLARYRAQGYRGTP